MKSKLIIGTAQFGLDYGINNTKGQIGESEIKGVLDSCKRNQVLTLDTAAAYGNAEERIGNYLKAEQQDSEFRLITKFKLKNRKSLTESLDCSLRQLAVSQVDTVMFHSFEDFKKIGLAELDAIMKYKGEKFLNLGISLYTNEQIDEISDLGIFGVVQIPFNVLDNQNLRGEFLAKLKSRNIETHTRSVFLQGLFFMGHGKLPLKLKPLAKYLVLLDEIAKDFHVSMESLCLHYVLRKDYIDGTLMGIDSLNQLENNLKGLSLNVPEKAISIIDEIYVEEQELLNPSIWHH